MSFQNGCGRCIIKVINTRFRVKLVGTRLEQFMSKYLIIIVFIWHQNILVCTLCDALLLLLLAKWRRRILCRVLLSSSFLMLHQFFIMACTHSCSITIITETTINSLRNTFVCWKECVCVWNKCRRVSIWKKDMRENGDLMRQSKDLLTWG